MLTCVLPGFSSQNLSWGQQVVQNCHLFDEGVLFEWKHWKSGNSQDFSPYEESQRIITRIGNAQFNIIAKSIGTLVTMHVLSQRQVNNSGLPFQLNKLILCGIPLNDMTEKDLQLYRNLQSIPYYKITVFQNEADTHASFESIKIFLAEINPTIDIQSMPRSDHDYPYFDEFSRKLAS